MNESEIIIGSLGCFLIGVFTAYLFKNLGSIWHRYGILIGGFLIVYGVIFAVLANAMIADYKNSVFSIVLAIGFLYRFFVVRV